MSAKTKARREKESRWDLIRKKHLNCINVTSETVRKFLAMDFVTDDKLRGGSGRIRRLDPVVVMNLRHEMIKRIRPREEKDLLPTRGTKNSPNERQSESSVIQQELDKFRSELQKKVKKSTPRSNATKMVEGKKTKKKRSILIKLNSPGIIESQGDVHATKKEQNSGTVEASTTLPQEVEEKPQSVRFVDNIEVITYSREASTMTGLDDGYDEEEDFEDEIDSLIEDEQEFFGLTRNIEDEGRKDSYLNITEKTVTTTTTMTTFQHFRYLSKDSYLTASPNPSTTTEEAESTESSEVNFYQMFDLEEQGTKEETESPKDGLNNTLTIKSLNYVVSPNPDPVETQETEDLVQEIIRVKAISNVANRHRLLRSYFQKWMHYTTIQKITKDSNITTKSQRMTKIDAYLKKIREQKKIAKQEEKAAQSKATVSRDNAIVMVKRYQSKLKLQQDIIEVQKLKLERQERMIVELRLSRLSEDAQKFKQDLREELRNAMRTGDVRLRARAKCLQVVGDVVEEEENKFVAYGNMIPKFLAKMQERALERQLRHEQARDRRIQLDQERDAQKMAYEEEKVRTV